MASLYIKARQPWRAEQLLTDPVPASLCRSLVALYAEIGDQSSVDRWLARWSALRPEDVRWIHHELAHRNLKVPSTIPPPDAFVPVPWRANKEIQKLIGAVNEILSHHPSLLDSEPELLAAWSASITNPSYSNVVAVAHALACLGINTNKLIRIVNFKDALCLLKPNLDHKDYTFLLRKAETTADVESLLAVTPDDVVYSPHFHTLVGSKHPCALLELALPPSTSTEIVVQAYWRAILAAPQFHINEILEWLLPMTEELVSSVATLKLSCTFYILQGDWDTVKRLMRAYILDRNLVVDPRLVAALQEVAHKRTVPSGRWHERLGKPQKGGNQAHLEEVLKQIMSK